MEEQQNMQWNVKKWELRSVGKSWSQWFGKSSREHTQFALKKIFPCAHHSPQIKNMFLNSINLHFHTMKNVFSQLSFN
jgi:hypothetical protein